jgi:hypothetical protein
MDLVFYAPNDDGMMIDIITDHARLMMQQVQEYAQRSGL